MLETYSDFKNLLTNIDVVFGMIVATKLVVEPMLRKEIIFKEKKKDLQTTPRSQRTCLHRFRASRTLDFPFQTLPIKALLDLEVKAL